MTNYYEELGISKDANVKEISEELIRQESLWRHREVNQPEKSTKMLSLIFEAREVFANEVSRRKYDEALNKKDRSDDPSAVKAEEFKKFLARVQEYYSDKQFDMAKLAMEKALALEEFDPDESHVDLYRYATDIYSKNNMFAQALEFANKALLANPDDLLNYEKKAVVLFSHLTAEENVNISQQCNETLRTTCDSWMKKAKQQNNTAEVANALQYLAFSFYVCGQDYNMAENYANESLSLDKEKSKLAREVIEKIYQPVSVDISEVNNYYANEPCYYWNEIRQMINELISSGIEPEVPYGYPLIKKTTYWHQEESKGEPEEISESEEVFAIARDGSFCKHSSTTTTYGRSQWSDNEESDYSCGTDVFLAEFDFDCYYNYCFSYPVKRGTEVYFAVFYGQAEEALNRDTKANARITRFCRKKGYGLYMKLKKILESQAEYISKYKKANEKYESEIAFEREKIRKKYEEKRSELSKETQMKMEEATQNEKIVQDLQNQISGMRDELSKLGLFSGRRKKELQNQIYHMGRKIDGTQTVKQVQYYYDMQKSCLGHEEAREISLKEQSVRAKYPLPQKAFVTL